MKKIYFSLAFAITVLMLACNSENKEQNADSKSNAASFDIQKARAFIDSINAKWVKQIKNGDSMSLASHYSSDAEMLMDKSEPIKGNGILSAWGDVVRSGLTDWTFTTTDLEGDANFLIETGTYEIKDANKKPADRGKYVVVWKQQNGEWRLYRDIGNSSPIESK
ncbi:MAG: YybH family protein [Chitinophagales bacterium]